LGHNSEVLDFILNQARRTTGKWTCYRLIRADFKLFTLVVVAESDSEVEADENFLEFFVRLERWDEYRGTHFYPLDNDHYAFRAVLIAKLKRNTVFRIRYPAFNGTEDVVSTFFTTYCQLQLDNMKEVTQDLFLELEAPYRGQTLTTILGQVEESMASNVDDEVDDEYVPILQAEIDDLPEDVEEAVSDNSFREGKGNHVPTIDFEPRKHGRSSCNVFSEQKPSHIFQYLAGPMLDVVLQHTNSRIQAENESNQLTVVTITKGELLVWVSCLIYMTIVQLPSTEMYWYPGHLQSYVKSVLGQKMTLRRYKEINHYLRFENYEAKPNLEDKAWKVRSIFTKFQESLRSVQPAPSQKLSLDESMGKCESIRNPIRRVEPNKPIKVGFKFFSLVEYDTKIIINLTLDDGNITTKTSPTTIYPYGATGRHVMDLIACLPGRGYILYMDNWYSGIPLAHELLLRNVHMIGTLRKDRGVPSFLQFKAKHPKPTENNPRGALKYACNMTNSIFIYSFMDNSACYFIDTAYGGLAPDVMDRQVGKDKVRFQVPKAIADYNRFMGGVDASDQIRNGIFGLEMKGRTSKWTVRFFEVLLSFALGNGYAIHRATSKNSLSHTDFSISVFEDLFNNTEDDIWLPHPLRLRQGGAEKIIVQHFIKSFQRGSRSINIANRAKVISCVYCPNKCNGKKLERRTKEYCSACLVPLHVKCFVSYHKRLADDGLEIAAISHPIVVELDSLSE
jgi:hypothetical protein